MAARKFRILRNVAFGIGVGGFVSYLGALEYMQYQFRRSEFVSESYKALLEYPQAEEVLGENIKQLRFDLSDKFIKKNDNYGQMVIPVIGTKTKGKVYSWTSKQISPDTQQEYWRVDRMDLMLHGYNPFTFFLRPEAQYVKNYKLEEWDLRR